MSIYIDLEQRVKDLLVTPTRFKSSRLYIKRILRDNGTYIYYFGKSWRSDLSIYQGSGKRWTNFISKYGKEKVEHVWTSEWYHDPLSIQCIAIRFSLENDIVASSTWANSKIENGLDGGLISNESKAQISSKLTGIKRKNGSGTSGTKWITNGIDRKCIKKNDIVPDGWRYGYGPVSGEHGLTGEKNSVYGKIKCNNGVIQKYFSNESDIPDGWFRGGLPKSKLNRKKLTL